MSILGSSYQMVNEDNQDVSGALSSSFQENMTDSDEEMPSLTANFTIDYCRSVYANETLSMAESHPEGFCNVSTDTLMCWPPTAFNESAVQKCFSELFEVKYDDTQNATRYCQWNGTWLKSNYNNCKVITEQAAGVETQSTIYFVGYTLSLVTLLIAVGIFTYFKDLRCMRNIIHLNLMWAYVLTYSIWILFLVVVQFQLFTSGICVFIMPLLHYFHITTFFWMFVEGLYLYILVVKTLQRENFKLRVYICIGWGLPLLFIIIWAIVKAITAAENPDMCVWFEKHDSDWIFQAPTVTVLLLNLLFLVAIMWVLITKLRSANTLETQQYHKAAKALLVLMPLLGINYVITLYAPTPDEVSRHIYESIRAVLLSTQGFTVALFYCFLNTEVQHTVRHQLSTWRTRRTLGTRKGRGSRKDWSPKSGTESIRSTSERKLFTKSEITDSTSCD